MLVLVLPAALQGQDRDPLRLELEGSAGGVRVELGPFLDEGSIGRSLESGLPVRIRLVTELWRDRLLDSQEGRHEWRAAVRYDPLVESYRVETEDGEVFSAASPGEAAAMLNEALSIPLGPRTPGRYYYLARLELETLSQSDLEELRRWLQGDLAPAISGEEDVGGALGRGVRRLLLRVLGLPAERFEARTPRFTWEG